MLFNDHHYFEIPKNIVFKINKARQVVFLHPDLSEALIFDFDENGLKVLKVLSRGKKCFSEICKILKAYSIKEKKAIWRFLKRLEKYHLVENITRIALSKPDDFTDEILDYYSRQLACFAAYETEDHSRYFYQKLLFQSHVVVLGLGGVGGFVLESLARAGVGRFTVVDHDFVEANNLTRQVLFTCDDLGKRKVDVASERIKKINSKITVHKKFNKAFDADFEKICSNVDLLVICCDEPSVDAICDFITPFCFKYHIPCLIGGGYSAHSGALPKTILPGRSVCWKCIKDFNKNSAQLGARFNSSKINGGSMGAIAGLIGNLAALEAIKILTKFSGISYANKAGYIRFSDLKVKMWPVKARPYCIHCRGIKCY